MSGAKSSLVIAIVLGIVSLPELPAAAPLPVLKPYMMPVLKPSAPILEVAPVEGRPDYYGKLWLAACPDASCLFAIDCKWFSTRPHDCPEWLAREERR